MKVLFGIDVGGTNIKIGLFDLNDKLLYQTSIKTNKKSTPHNIFTDIKNETSKILKERNLKNSDVLGYGFGIPGPVKDNVVSGCPNLGWKKTSIEDEFYKVFQDRNIIVKSSNDATMAAFGEYNMLKEKHDIVFMTLGTGVGGGIVMDGKLVEGTHGSAAEIGHLQIDYENPVKCTCGLYGCLETVTSIRGFKEVGLRLLKNYQGKTSLNKNNLTPPNIFKQAAKNDQLAIKIIDKVTDYLGRGCAAIALMTNPQTFIIGGGISNAGAPLIQGIEAAFKKYAYFGVKDATVKQAVLGGDAGIYGAYFLIKEEVK